MRPPKVTKRAQSEKSRALLTSAWQAQLTVCTCKERLTNYLQVIVRSLYCTTSRATSTTRLLELLAVRLATASRSCIRHALSYAICFEQTEPKRPIKGDRERRKWFG